jgi:hypothetical protein
MEKGVDEYNYSLANKEEFIKYLRSIIKTISLIEQEIIQMKLEVQALRLKILNGR